MRTPLSTYRIQVRESFDFDRTREVLPYLHELGVDWVYLSPVLKAASGSDHGYDVVDPTEIDPARGGADALRRLADAAHELGMGVLIDIVPNHTGVAVAAENPWWWDVLTHGQESEYAEFFDIDWEYGNGRVRIPVLGDGDDELDKLTIENGELCYFENHYPIAPGTGDGTPREVHERQNYELMNWRLENDQLNYRRFFAVSTLAGMRVEDPRVFDETHREIGRWFRDGIADGLRVDHPDGLRDPAGYLERLRDLTGGSYVLIEKILEPGERLNSEWATEGTTGYDVLALIDRLFTQPEGRAELDDLDRKLRGLPAGESVSWHEMIAGTKRGIADSILRSEINRLGREARAVRDFSGDVEDALAEITALFPVYRSYLPNEREALDEALAGARAARPDLADTIDELAPLIEDPTTPVGARLQQTTGMVMAKGVEDTAFYRYSRLTSLTEVGADPSIFSATPDEFHIAMAARAREFPHAMSTLSTHDTKRGEAVRARIAVIAENPELWADALESLQSVAPIDNPPFANLVWQAIVGAWPASRERLHAYVEKAAREANEETGWTRVNEQFEEQLHRAVDGAFDNPLVAAVIGNLYDAFSVPGWHKAMGMKLVQLTAPGVPDVYQGSELWEQSLVDPDNRRPVDFVARMNGLQALRAGAQPEIDESGGAQLLVTHAALTTKREHPEWFRGYSPVHVTGSAADNAIAFDRGGAITVATRFPLTLQSDGGWGDTAIELPEGEFRDRITGRTFAGGRVTLAGLLAEYPVALLTSTDAE